MQAQEAKSYLALGDSYTIGERVDFSNNWPSILVQQLESDNISFQQPKIIAKTGWRTDELIAAIQENEELKPEYDLVSLLIGVNNQYQKKDISIYETELETLINLGLKYSKNGAKGMFMLSIPDYSVSEFAKEKSRQDAGREIDKYNEIARDLAERYKIAFYDINPISKTFEGKEAYFVSDKLHPSAEQYQKWVDVFYKDFKKDFF
ncbi:MAG: SGNH/GDSL hydrolase family protein [Bacteroidota bacterium]